MVGYDCIWSRVTQHRVYHYRDEGNKTLCGKTLGEGETVYESDVQVSETPPNIEGFRLCSKCEKREFDQRTLKEVYLDVIDLLGFDTANQHPSFSKRQLIEIEKRLGDD